MSYTRKEFRHLCVSMGYCSSAIVTEYFNKYPKDTYEDKDFIEAYRMAGVYTSIKKRTKRKSY